MTRPAPLLAAVVLGVALVVDVASGQDDEAVPSVASLLVEGERHYESRRYSEAITAFEAALERADDKERAHVERTLARVRGALGMELLGAGETRQAEREFRRAVELAEDFYALFGLGYLASLRLDDEQARGHLERAVELQGDYARAHVLLALLAYRAGRTADALERLEKALALDAEDAEACALRDRWKRGLAASKQLLERRSGRFLVRSHRQLPAATVRRVGKLLRQSHDDLAERLATWSRQQVVVILLPDGEFHDATGSRHFVGGTYDGQLKLPVPEAPEPSEERWDELAGAVRHELAHVLIRQVLPECPGWLNEGIAQHFETEVDAAALRARLRSLAAARGRLRFATIPAQLWEIEDEALARQIYLQSLAFVGFLVREHHEFRLRLLLGAAREEGSLGRAFRRTYGDGLESLEDRWWEGIKGAGSP